MADTLPARTRVDAIAVAVAFGGSNVASYLLTVIAARLLAPPVFGEMGSLLALLAIGAVPAMGLQTVIALRVARAPEQDRGPLVTLGLMTSATVLVTALAVSPVLMALLHLPGPWAVLLLACSLAPITLVGLCYGVLQGTQRFRSMACLIATEGVGRVGGTLLGLLVFRTPAGAFAGTVAGSVVVAFAGWLICGRPVPGPRTAGHVRDVLHTVQALLALVLLVNLDLVLARHSLPAREAGEYAVGSVITKIAYWLPYAIAVVVLPKLADEKARRRNVLIALGVCAAVDAVVVLGCAVFGRTAPVLVTSDMLEAMRPGSVVVDLAVESGGNVEGIEPGQVIQRSGVTLIALTGYGQSETRARALEAGFDAFLVKPLAAEDLERILTAVR